MEIKDRMAIVTGGGGGIGSAVARRWMAGGARHVVVADRDGDAARAVGEEIGCLGVELDVTDEAAVVALVERVEDEIGPVDIFFSNAGAGGAGGGVEASNEAWQAAMGAARDVPRVRGAGRAAVDARPRRGLPRARRPARPGCWPPSARRPTA